MYVGRTRRQVLVKLKLTLWHPTDYYSRYRPGFKTVILSLVIFSCFVHYFVLCASYFVSKMRIRQ